MKTAFNTTFIFYFFLFLSNVVHLAFTGRNEIKLKRQIVLDAVFGLQIKFLGRNSFVYNIMYMYVNLCEVVGNVCKKSEISKFYITCCKIFNL